MSARGSPVPGRAGSDLSATRSKQSKRDEALRRKIENDLIKRRPGSKRTGHSSRREQRSHRQHQAGTVSALRPLPALTVPHSITVADASQLCAAKRTDCVLVVDEDEHLCGIFTAKDLAFRVIGEGLEPRSVPVSQIMTPNPMVTRDTTSATDALQTMVSRGFRHLPVCNEDGDVVGLLDITKVFHSSLEKLERAYNSSQQLYSALEGVQTEWSGANQALVNYVEQIRESMAAPEISSLIDARTSAVTVHVRSTVRDAAKLMREHRTTAVIVTETPVAHLAPGEAPKIAGIFTSKDIVLRVIAAGLDSRTCSVVRVMTPHPDTVTPTTTIQRALRKMHDGHYLNLPIVQEDGFLVACVDVLKLTYATLEQISAIDNTEDGNGGETAGGGPMWSRFFNSFAAGAPDALLGDIGGDGDTESIISASDAAPRTPSRHALNQSMSELNPGDSASATHDDDSVLLHGLRSGKGPESSVAPLGGSEEGTYLFKFLAPGGATHRFQSRYAGEEVFEHVSDIISGKLSNDPFFQEDSSRDAHDFKLNYLDDDGDLVLISTSKDVEDAVKVARKQGKDRVVLQLKGGKGWESAMGEAKAAAQAKSLAAIAEDETEAAEKEKESSSQVGGRPTKTSRSSILDEELLFGVLPKDLAVPAAIAFLGVTIIGVFTASRLTSR